MIGKCPHCGAEDCLTPYKGTAYWFCPACGENIHVDYIEDADA